MVTTVIFAIYVPFILKFHLQIHGEPMGDGTFIAVDPEKVGIMKL